MPPWSVPFWHKDSFELKAVKEKQTQEGLSAVRLYAFDKKQGINFPL